jgi:hypothetical protein
MDATLPLVAIGLGVGLFAEQVNTSTMALVGEGSGIFLALVGIVALDTSPTVRRQHRLERRNRAQPRSDEREVSAAPAARE